jgi:predicted hydrocarbon binding protein
MTTPTTNHEIVALGSGALHALRRALSRDLGDRAAVCLQEAGFAAGEQVYQRFLDWLPEYTSVDDPAELDSSMLGEVLSAFFEELGWGRLTVEKCGENAIAITSTDWAEADPSSEATSPSCHIASGLFADFMGRLSGTPVAVMEVECRTLQQPHCRFLVGAPETMDSVYEALAAGNDYESVLSGG